MKFRIWLQEELEVNNSEVPCTNNIYPWVAFSLDLRSKQKSIV